MDRFISRVEDFLHNLSGFAKTYIAVIQLNTLNHKQTREYDTRALVTRFLTSFSLQSQSQDPYHFTVGRDHGELGISQVAPYQVLSSQH